MVLGITLDDTNYNTLDDVINIITKLNINHVQIFLGDKRLTTLRKKIKPTHDEIYKIKKFIKEHNINLFVHSILTLNYCKDPNSLRNKWGIDNLIYDMNLCYQIGGKGCVIHMGSSVNECLKNFIKSIVYVLKKTKKIPIILETPVDKPTRIGGNLEEYAKIYHHIPKKYIDRVKCCIDTQHLFASGYNFRKVNQIKNYFDKFDQYIGLQNLVLIHLNDSDKIYHSCINRHESIGKGYIFKNNKIALQYLINFALKHNIPMILETEYKYYQRNINYAKKIGGMISIKNKIVNIFEGLLFYYETFGNKKNTSTKYRIESYKKAIKIIKNLNQPIYHSNNVKNILGKGMIVKINEINKTGTLKSYENIKNKILKYKFIKNFKNIWGVGPKIAKNIVNKGITSINNLKNKNFKLTNQQKIGLQYYNNLKENIPNNEIKNTIKYLNLLLKKNKLNVQLYSAGSHRMKKEKSGDIDILVVYKNIDTIKKKDNIKNKFYNILYKNKIIRSTLLSGTIKSIYIIKTKYNKKFRKMDVAFITKELLPWYILYFGSSKDFSKKIRRIASQKGYKLTEKGLYDKKSGKKINFVPKNEKDIFTFLQINYVHPENR